MEQQNENIIARYQEQDAEILKGNGLTPKNGPEQGGGSLKSKYWKFVGGFFVLMLVGIIGIPLVGQYMQKQEEEEKQARYAASDQAFAELQERLKNDTDGGATPEETLKMFTDALKAGDVEQASKYFVIEPKERQEALIDLIGKLQDVGEMEKFIEYLGKAKLEKDSDTSYGYAPFSYLENGRAQIFVEITKDKYSTVWKIESLMF